VGVVKQKRRSENRSAVFVKTTCEIFLARQWPLKHRHPWAPQRVPLSLTMGLRGDQPIQMAGVTDGPVLAISTRRRILLWRLDRRTGFGPHREEHHAPTHFFGVLRVVSF
jgi:hypothetical protein